MSKTLRTLLAASLLLGTGQAMANADQGKSIYEANCQGCHDTSTHVGANQSIKDLHGLQRRVRFCSQQLRRQLFDDEQAAIVDYLNRDFYRFQ